MRMSPSPQIIPLDLTCTSHAEAFLALMDHYAQDPMGGGEGLSDAVRPVLVDRLRAVPHFYGALACLDERPVGLVNCFFGFSTFAAAPLLNIHDLVVHASVRGRGVVQHLLDHVAEVARVRGCCKLTLEVLSNNSAALAAYARAGYVPYQLDPAAGRALFLQKKL